MNRSIGALFDTRVVSYNWTARPQKSVKFASIWVNVPAGSLTGPPFQYLSWNTDWISTLYVVFSPLLGKRDRDPSMLSFGSTTCRPRGVRLSSLRPTIGNGRLKNDISRSLVGGPTAWDARLELGIRTLSWTGALPVPLLFTQ